MGMMIQFPSPALWHQVLNGPPVSREQGTRNPIGGFNEMVHAQLAQQNALAGLQPPLLRQPAIQRPPQKDAREKDRNPRGQQPPQDQHYPDEAMDRGANDDALPQPLVQDGCRPSAGRAVWA